MLEEAFGNFFLNPAHALISIAVGYFVCRNYKKGFKKENEFDKILFSAVTGYLIYVYSLILFSLAITFVNGFFIESRYDAPSWTVAVFVFSLMGFYVYEFLDKRKNKKFFSETKETLFLLIEIMLLFSLAFTIASYFSIFKPAFYEQTSTLSALAVFLISFIAIVEKISPTDKTYLPSKKKAHIIAAGFMVLVVLISIFTFPKTTVSTEQITNYVADTTYGIDNLKHVQLFEHVTQPVEFNRVGMLGVIFIENKGKLVVDNSLGRFTPPSLYYEAGLIMDVPDNRTDSGRIITALGNGIIGNGITNLSYNEKYGGYVIKFDNLDKYNLTNTYLSGYRKIKVTNNNFNIGKENTGDKYTVKIFTVNNLDGEVVSWGNVDEYNYDQANKTCLIDNVSVKMYNLTSGKSTNATTSNIGSDANIIYRLNGKNKDIWDFAMRNNILYLQDIQIPAHTNMSISLRVLCK